MPSPAPGFPRRPASLRNVRYMPAFFWLAKNAAMSETSCAVGEPTGGGGDPPARGGVEGAARPVEEAQSEPAP